MRERQQKKLPFFLYCCIGCYGMKIESDYSLLSHNTFALQALCRWFVEYRSVEELQTILRDEYFREQPFLHIGGGSNLLFVHDFDGIVLHSKIEHITVLEENKHEVDFLVGAGILWDDLVAYCVKNGWYGAENLSLIPGETGAAAIQNIGAYGVEIKDLIRTVHVVDIVSGKEERLTNSDCRYAYRTSIFKEELKEKKIVTGVHLHLSKQEKYSIEYGNIKEKLITSGILSLQAVREAIIAIRSEKLPDWKIYGNAGSFFINPSVALPFFEALKERYPSIQGYLFENETVKIPAAWLIEQCGWRGKRTGNVGVWPLQPLVLVNYGGASGAEIASLADTVKQSVMKKFGIELTPEVMYV